MQPIIPFGKLLEQIREKNQPERQALYRPLPGDPLYPEENPDKPQRPIRGDESERGVAIIDFTV